ncbi:multidrug resistance protein A [Pseudomonas sp. Os17]|nr:multidrug resistance protein A [Pseudomonas sp. Os17]BAQ83633.1 multidrug resistance efflux pump [Pseudomonas sp. St29]
MHADIAGLQLGGGAGQVAGAHEGQKHFELFQGQLFVDEHGPASADEGLMMPDESESGRWFFIRRAPIELLRFQTAGLSLAWFFMFQG